LNAPLSVSPKAAGFLVETSAMAAILLEEPDAAALAERIGSSQCVSTSVNVFETVLALSKETTSGPQLAYEAVSKFLEAMVIEIVPFTPEMIPHAVAARERYGRGRKRLNMGDCLSYAAARQLGLKLIYKGDDFAATDVND
jgi:ribonuclease VapC